MAPLGEDGGVNSEFNPEQWIKFRKLMVFAIFLAVTDVLVIGALLYAGVLHLPY